MNEDITSIKGKRVEFYLDNFDVRPIVSFPSQVGIAMTEIDARYGNFFICVQDEHGQLHTIQAGQVKIIEEKS